MVALGLLVVIGLVLAAWIGHVAEERGRSGVGWMAAAVLMGAVGFGLGSVLLEFVFGAEATSASNLLLLTSLAPVAGGFAFILATAAVVHRLPPRVAGGASWRVYRLGDGTQAGFDATLAIVEDGLRLDDASGKVVTITPAAFASAAGDGEALRIRWREGGSERTLVLLPTDGPETRAWRVSQSVAIARRLSERCAARA